MKMRYLSIILLILAGSFVNAQEDLRMGLSVGTEKKQVTRQKKAKMQRIQQWKAERQRRLVEELQINNEAKKQEFKRLLNEYNNRQEKIKRKFKPNSNFDQMSDEEAKKQLQQSFQVGKELLENRKKYSDKFQKVMKPQKVLKMFHYEGRMRREMMKRRDAKSRSVKKIKR